MFLVGNILKLITQKLVGHKSGYCGSLNRTVCYYCKSESNN